MPRKTSPNGGPTKARQFRLTDAELATIDRLAESLRPAPDITITRTDVLRVAVREMAERRLKPRPPA